MLITFTRVQNEQESLRMARVNSSPTEIVKPITPADQIVKEAKIEVHLLLKKKLKSKRQN